MKHFNWALQVQELHAVPQYELWMPGCNVVEVDKIGVTNDFARGLDFSGLDKIIELSNGQRIHLAQRFRRPPYNPRFSVDFSLRYTTWNKDHTEKQAEYFNFIEAYKQGYYYPSRYAFGVTNTISPDSGFKCFYIYNMTHMLDAIINDEIKNVGIHKNPDDGKKAIYFKLDDLDEFIVWKLKTG